MHPAVVPASPPAGDTAVRRIAPWLREPLLHFSVLGAVIFAVYFGVAPRNATDKLIVVTPALEQEVAARFSETTQRAPTAEELDNLIEGWVQSEVLYREGLAIGLDKGDSTIRDRVILNMKQNARVQAVVEAPSEAEMRAWFEPRRAQYDKPRRFDILDIHLRDRRDFTDAEVRQLLDALNAGVEPLLLGYDPAPYPKQTAEKIGVAFGAEGLARLEHLPVGGWIAIRTANGWHVVGLSGVEAAQTADFETLKSTVRSDWLREQQLRLAAVMVKGMRANYQVSREHQR
jgi:hypothetical protein